MKMPSIKKVVHEPDHALCGQMVRQARKGGGITLRELSRRLNISAPYLSDLERGNRKWNSDLFRKVWEAVTE